MAGWTEHKGKAVVLGESNIDTDQLIPARFMSASRDNGYGDFLLYDVRRDAEGELMPDFPLNTNADASILIAGRNFGSGSSREAAVYALVDAGFQVVVATSFGDIFLNNAVNNGLLPAILSEADFKQLTEDADNGSDIRIDLDSRSIITNGHEINFAIDESHRIKLINGWDDIDLTLAHNQKIDEFKRSRKITATWTRPQAVI
ncbi:MAG: 3-isopropylmalate dehydratase small subunit [Pseudomonadota bacterium]